MLFRKDDVVCNRYRVVDGPLEGGQAYIYQAQDTEGHVVALKVLRDPLDYEAKARFRTEVGVLRAMDHPNVLSLTAIDFHEEPGQRESQLVCVLEWIEGGMTLEKLFSSYLDIREDKLAHGSIAGLPGPCMPLSEVMDIMHQVAQAVAYAHSKGFVHRDLKPSNILLKQEVKDGVRRWLVKVADFGIVKVLETLPSSLRLTKTGTLGTPDYMSPEQGARMFDACNDIWAFWVIMYELMTGRLPYKGHNLAQWATIWIQIRRGEITYQPIHELCAGVAEDLQLMVKAGLNPDETKRPSMAETAKMLEQIKANLDPTLGATEFHMVVPSSHPPQHNPDAMTMGATGAAQPASPASVRIMPAEPRQPKTPSQVEVLVPQSVQVAVLKKPSPKPRSEAKLAKVELDIEPRPARSDSGDKGGRVKKVRAQRRSGRTTSPRPFIIPPPEASRVSAVSVPMAPPEPAIVYARQVEDEPVPPVPTQTQTVVPPKPGGGIALFVVMLLAAMAIGYVTRSQWLLQVQGYLNRDHAAASTGSAAPMQTPAPTPVQQPAAARPSAPRVVPTVGPVQPSDDDQSGMQPSGPVRPRSGGRTTRPTQTRDGPQVIEGLPPNAPPPLNQ